MSVFTKKLGLIPLLLVMGTFSAAAQDIIVTTIGESISCRIIDQDSIQVVFIRHGREQRGEAMPKYLVHSIVLNDPEEMKWVKKDQRRYKYSKENKMKGFRTGLSAGYSRLLAKTDAPHGFSQYMEALRSGFNIRADADYFFGRYFGLGLRYALFHTENQADGVYVSNGQTGQWGVGEVSDNINAHSIGLAPSFRAPIRKGKAHFLTTISAGYMGWINNATVLTPVVMSANAFYNAYSLAMDVQIHGKLHLGVSGEILFATSKSVHVTDGTNSTTQRLSDRNRLNMMRVDANLGLRYYW